MFKNNVYTFRNFPVEEKERKWTDCICTILAAIFALTLFISSFVIFKKSNFLKSNFPVDDTGATCMLDQTDAPYIYFQNINDLSSQKHCLKQCPTAGASLRCSDSHPCPGLISSYDSIEVINPLGGFCEPKDAAAKQKLWENHILADKASLLGGYDSILISLAIGVCVGIIYLIAMVSLPRMMTYTVFILAFASLLTAAIILMAQPIKLLSSQNSTWNIILGIFFIMVSVCLLIFFFCYQQEIELGSIFMFYANVFLKENIIIFAYIPLYMVLSFGLVVLCVWQFVAFGSYHDSHLNPGDLYYASEQSIFLQVLNAIEFIWGLQFLRDSFNYIVSGNAVEWYFNYREKRPSECSRPFLRLITKNFGSVVGGSFMNAFFNIFGLFYDLFRCNPKGECGRASKCWKESCCCCNFIFELVRPDAYAYIHLSGIPYCNAARQCEALCERTHLFSSDHSCIRLYRAAAQIFLVSLTVILTFIVLFHKAYSANFIIVFLIMVTSYLAVTHFADLHSNAAEGLITCYLAETNCESPDGVEVCPDAIVHEINSFQQKYNLLY